MIVLLPLFVAVTLLVTAALTPPTMSLLMHLESFDYPFSRVFDRVAMLVILVLLIVFRRSMNLSVFKEAIQQGSWKSRVVETSLGVSLSFIPVAPVVFLLVYSGDLVWSFGDWSIVVQRLAKALGAGLVISLIEESFFRVLLYRRLKESFSLWKASVLCCVLYALAHFISPVKTFAYGPEFQWDAGFIYLYHVAIRLFQPGLLPAAIGLLMVGAILCYVIHNSNRFYLCVGLHCGWVLALKGTKYITERAPDAMVMPGAGSRYFLVAQPEAWIALVITALLVYTCCSRSGGLQHA